MHTRQFHDVRGAAQPVVCAPISTGPAGGRAGPRAEPARPMHEIEANERAAYRSLFEVGADLFGRASFDVREVDGATAFLSPLVRRPGVFNRVLGLGLDRPMAAGQLRMLREEYRAAGCVPSFELLPERLDADACAHLRAQQIRRAATSVQLVRMLDGESVEPATSGIREPLRPPVRVASGPGCRVVAALCAEVFDLPAPVLAVLEALQDQPGWTHWVALDGGRACGAALTYTVGDRCWFGWACTLPQWRGRGVKGALDDARIAAADDEGCAWISTDTGTGTPASPDRSLHSLLCRGFNAAHLRASYLPGLWPGTEVNRGA